MPSVCPSCQSNFTKVIETRSLKNGSRRRRVKCKNCTFRWTDYEGERSPPGPKPHADRSKYRPQKPPLTPDDIRLILTSPLSSTKIAKLIDRSKQTVTAIRLGEIHRNTCIDLPRWTRKHHQYNPNGVTCESCRQWIRGRCGFEIPEAALDGVLFAQECAAFTSNTDPVG